MNYKVLSDVIPLSVVSVLVDYFNNNVHQHRTTNSMTKIDQPWTIPFIKNNLYKILNTYVDVDLPNLGDNLYKHSFPYFPHVDLENGYPCFNCLIPLHLSDNKPQHFVIFNQFVNDTNNGKTWLGNFSLDGNFEANKKRKFPYNDPIVENLTTLDIDQEFYNTYLDHEYRDRELFKGMTGIATNFKPGNLILFDSKYIHCTGKMNNKYKIGLSLRFKGKLSEALK